VAVHYRTMADMLHRSAASRTWWVDPLDYATRGVENATIPVLLLAVKDEGRGGRYVVMLLEQFLMTINYEELLHYLTNIYWTI
jgi:hypothetical protein